MLLPASEGRFLSLQAYTSRIEPGIVVLHLSGNIVLRPDGEAGLPLVEDLIRENFKRIIVDLSHVEKIDSSGVQTLLGTHTTMRNAGGAMHVAAASPAVARLFRITQLDRIIQF